MKTPYFAEEVNEMVLDFGWNHKPVKIKETTLTKSRQKSGLEIEDFIIFDKELKLNWVSHLCSVHNATWKYISTSLLANVGGNLLFQCNYD